MRKKNKHPSQKNRDFQRREQILEKKLEETTNLPKSLEETNNSDNPEEYRLVFNKLSQGQFNLNVTNVIRLLKPRKG